MKHAEMRDAIWCGGFVEAWRVLRGLRVFDDGKVGTGTTGRAATAEEIGVACAKMADAARGAFDAACAVEARADV